MCYAGDAVNCATTIIFASSVSTGINLSLPAANTVCMAASEWLQVFYYFVSVDCTNSAVSLASLSNKSCSVCSIDWYEFWAWRTNRLWFWGWGDYSLRVIERGNII